MACLQVPKLGIPDIPGLSLLLGPITIGAPGVNIDFCCKLDLRVPGFPITIPINVALTTLGPTSDAILASIQSAVDQLNTYLDQLTIDCPLD